MSSKTDIIVIGASMGGFHALRDLISELPKDLKAAVLVVLHIPSEHKSYLADSFGKDASIPVLEAKTHQQIKPGHVYVAVPDFHLLVKAQTVELSHGPKHNLHRPAVDTLFYSAAKAYGARVIGVVLTGALDDGTAGLMEIKRHGGVSVIQDPKDAANPSMPESARDCVPIDHCVPLSEMAALLTSLAGQPVSQKSITDAKKMPKPSEPELSTHICPECNGPMWSLQAGNLLHFHCRIGHAFSGQSLLVEKNMALETALWSAVNALKDKANIARQLMEQLKKSKSKTESAAYYEEQINTALYYAELLREFQVKQTSPTALAHEPGSKKKKARKLTKHPTPQSISHIEQ
jgi:two-component system chemotaxis response regulator CheB